MIIDQVMEVTNKLLELLKKEKSLLKNKDMKGVTHILEEKENLSHSYYNLLAQIKGHPRIHERLLDELKIKTQEIKELMEQNMGGLLMMAEANENVLKALVDKIASHSGEVGCYTDKGEKQAPIFKQKSGFSVNQYI